MDPTFGFPSLVRFSWTTIKVAMDKDAHKVKWLVIHGVRLANHNLIRSRIDEGEASLIGTFQTPTGRDKDRCAIAKDLHIRSVGML